jgi:hypothetical protein
VSSQDRLHWIMVVLIHGFEFSCTIHARGKRLASKAGGGGRWPLDRPGISQQGRLQLEQLSDSGCRTLLTGGRTDVPHKDM